MIRTTLFAIALALAAPAAAQDMQFDPTLAEACLADSGHIDDCAGISANACMETNDGGYTTVGMGGCLSLEHDYWDGRLNTAYANLMDEVEATDAEMKEIGATVPSQSDALLAMQRAWIGFRDTKCDYIRSQWGGGTGGGPATVSCLLTETAAQWQFLSNQIGQN